MPKRPFTLIQGGNNGSPHAPDKPARPAKAPDQADQREFVDYLFRRYRHSLDRYLASLKCSPEEAEEILQEAYIRIIQTTDLDRLEVRARSYLFTIATNLLRDQIRRDKARSKKDHTPIESVELVSDAPSPDRVAEWHEGLARIKQCLLELKPRVRQVFLLHVFEQQTLKQIAATLEISSKTAERDLALALEFCQSRLKD